MTKKDNTRYWIYASLRGSGLGNHRVRDQVFHTRAEAEAFCKDYEARFPNAECAIIRKGEEE
jgi:hypothetical protein